MLLLKSAAQNFFITDIPNHDQLPTWDIVCTLQDSEGYMWYGTAHSGLYRDDGYTIKGFRAGLDMPDLLESNSITSIAEDSDSQIWFGTKRGTYILNKKNYQIRPLSDTTIKRHTIHSIYATSEGSIWITTTMDNVLHRYTSDERKKGTYEVPWQGEVKQIHRLYEDDLHTIWGMQKEGGILKFDNENNSFIPYPWPFNEYPTCMVKDALHPYYWIGTWGKGVVRFNPNEKALLKMFKPQLSTTEEEHDLQRGYIKSITQDNTLFQIWIATSDNLYVFKTEGDEIRPSAYTSEMMSTGKKMIYEMTGDRSGNLWVASYYPNSFIISFGSDNFQKRTIPTIKEKLGLPLAPEWIVHENKNYWFWQMRLGLCYYDTSSQRLSVYGGKDMIASMEKSRQTDGVYLIKWNTVVQLFQYENNQIRATDICTLSTKQHERIRRLHEDLQNNLWIGTTYDLARYSSTTGELQRVWEGTGIINAITSSEDGSIFIATESNGFLVYSTDGRKQQYMPRTEDNFKYLTASSQHKVWAITEQNRIYSYDSTNENFDQLTFEYNLSQEIIYGAQCDNQDNLWILTDKKIIIYNPNTQSIRLIRTSNPTVGMQNFLTLHRDNDGKMHVGGFDGVLVFDAKNAPISMTTNRTTHLTDLRVNGISKNVSHDNVVILQSNERNVELFFSTFDIVNRDNIQFAFRYKGTASHWNYLPEGQNNIYLTELSKGDYELEIKATDKNGSWSKQVLSVMIRRLPAWYETWWAYILYTLILVTIVVIAAWRYVKHSKKQQQDRIDKEVSQMKFRFFTNVSHELRTPLTLIITPLEAIVRQISDVSIKSQLELVNQNAQSLLALVNQLLDFRKIEMGGEVLSLTQGDIDAFLTSIYESFRLLTDEKKIHFEYHSTLSSFHIFLDHDKLRKMVNNLLANAIKFTPESGNVTLWLKLDVKDGKEYIVISVADTGKGIPQSELSRVFDRFHQIATTDNNTGSGIGLHLVKEYATMHKGSVSVESELGKGTVFTIRFPCNLIPKEELAIKLNEPQDRFPHEKTKKILIVEDNEKFRSYMKVELSHYYEIFEAVNGKEGERIALEKDPDIIITDLMMPEMDGLELTRRIKNNIDISHIPVILLTANDNIENEEKGYKEGADAYISKPFYWNILLSRIQNLIEQKQQRQYSFDKDLGINASELTISSIDERLIDKVLKLIDKNLNNSEYTIEDLSRDMAMSRVSLYRKINSITGNSPTEFVKNIRLKKAAVLLRQGEMTVAQVAYSVGFATPSHFTQSFKKAFGVLPTQYK